MRGTQSNRSPNYVLGTEVDIPVDIPVDIELQSFGLMYGHEDQGALLVANAVVGLYSADPASGLPQYLVLQFPATGADDSDGAA